MRARCLLLISGICIFLVGCTSQTSIRSGPTVNSTTLDSAVDKMYPTVVRIEVVDTEPGDGRLRRVRAMGSGSIISPDGYVITNHHVAGHATRLVCRLADRQEVDATLVGTDAMADIAVVKLKTEQLKPGTVLPVAGFGDNNRLRIGDTVLAMGCPAGLTQAVTVGVVSNDQMIMVAGWADDEALDGELVGTIVRWIGHDAIIYGGNSGGPLVNTDGQIVGINEIGIGSLSGAIPSNLAKSVALQIIHNSKVERSWTGLECQPTFKKSGISGVVVSGVFPASPAVDAGLRPGDVITSINGQKVKAAVYEELPLFNQMLLSQPVGQLLTINYLRKGSPQTTTLTTRLREPAMGKDVEFKEWAMTARNMTALSALETRRANEGVLITSIRSGGPCSNAKPGLNPGDLIRAVNGQPVKNLQQLQTLTASLCRVVGEKQEVLVLIDRGTRQLLSVARIGLDKDPQPTPSARKAWIGISTQVLTEDLARALNHEGTRGVRVTEVIPGTNADKAGLKVGDLIVKFDGDSVAAWRTGHEEVLLNMVRRRPVDKTVELQVIRDDKLMALQLQLQESPLANGELKSYTDHDLEFTAHEISLMEQTARKWDSSVKGLLVDSAAQGGWADLAGLRSGDLIVSVEENVTPDANTLEKVLKELVAKKSTHFVFLVRRGVHTRFVEFSPTWN